MMTPAAERRAELRASLESAEVAVTRAAELLAYACHQLADDVASIEAFRAHVGPPLFEYRAALEDRARLRKELLASVSAPTSLEVEAEERAAVREAERMREEEGDMLATSRKEDREDPQEETG